MYGVQWLWRQVLGPPAAETPAPVITHLDKSVVVSVPRKSNSATFTSHLFEADCFEPSFLMSMPRLTGSIRPTPLYAQSFQRC